MSLEDRRVHAITNLGSEIVRYDRAGKWYLENESGREPISFAVATWMAAGLGTVYFGVPGGSRFDASVRRNRASPEALRKAADAAFKRHEAEHITTEGGPDAVK